MSGPDIKDTAPARVTELRRKLFEYEQMFWLASRDVLYFAEATHHELDAARGGWRVCVLCNDTFGYACADAEIIAPGQAREVRAFYEAFGWDGVIAWVAEKRQQAPLKELQTPKYFQAKAALLEKAVKKAASPNPNFPNRPV